MRIAFATFGCKINQYETENIRRAMAEQGGEIVPFEGTADVYVVNTCSVTARSDYQCRQAIRAAVRRNAGARVIVTGCYADTRSDEISSIPGVTQIVPNREKMDIPRQVLPLDLHAKSTSCSACEAPSGRTRTFLKIQDGCDSRCSYCIVPLARGSSRSVSPADVRVLFDSAVERGVPEVVLSGIHIGRYGADFSPASTLTSLVQDLIGRRGAARIRLSSIEPNEITPEIIDLLNRGLCRHLHIPLQSGDNGILRAMNRKYNAEMFGELIGRIAGQVPDVAIGTDVMVGFPGEGEEEYRRTYELIERLPISHLHVFSYSRRPGTSAASLSGQVPEPVKKERNAELRSLGARKHNAFAGRFLHESLSSVIESKFDGLTRTYSGLTDNYLRLAVSGVCEGEIGKILTVRITDVDQRGIFGCVL